MKTLKYSIAYLILLFIPFTGIQAQDIISSDELMKIMRKPNVVVVSTRTTDDYNQVHITGAVHINYQDLNDDMAMLISPAEIAKILGDQGISETKSIILYDDGTQKYSGRMYWVLKYLGAPDVKILDGGMPAWRASRKPVTKTPTVTKKATFNPSVKPALLATIEDVKKAQSGNGIIIDARSPEEFAGTATTKLRPGHVPNAINIEYTEVMDDNGLLKATADLQTLFNKNGVTKDKTIIVYCETSVRAGILFQVLTSALDYPNVKLYDGAYREWQNTPANKVVQ